MKKNTVIFLAVMVETAGAIITGICIGKKKRKKEEKWKELSEKHLALMRLLNQWVIVKQERKSIIDYFQRQNIKSIAIYGMSYVGERLLQELNDSEVEVKYAIDKNAEGIFADIDVIQPDEDLPIVDAIVVTPIFYFDEIENMLEQKTEIEILSMEDILYDL